MTVTSDSYTALAATTSLLGLVAYFVIVVGLWKTFRKAGEPGWPAIIPFLNFYYMVKISGRPGWWFLLFFVPILNIVIWLMVAMDTAYAFGKSNVYGILLFFLPWIGYLLVGFGDAQYRGARPI